MAKLRNVLFVLISAVLLLLPLCRIVASGVVPTFELSTESELEGRKYAKLPVTTSESVLTGVFQDGVEDYLSDHVPLRDSIMIANAATQRMAIELANLPFSFEVYPTYFGSSIAVDPKSESLLEMPREVSKRRVKSLKRCAKMLNNTAAQNPNVKWYVGIAERSQTLTSAPIHDLVSKPADSAFYVREFFQKLSDDVTAIDLFYQDYSEFCADYYKTDHHWKIEGGVLAYQKICAAMGIQAAECEFTNAYSGPSYGAYARTGLIDVIGDTIDDVVYARSPLEVRVNGTEESESVVDASYAPDYDGYEKSSKFASTYAEYFHTNYGLIQIDNPKASSDDSLLIVGDSYTNCIERLFAENFRTVYVADPRYFNSALKKEWSSGTFIKEHGVSSVLVLFSGNNLKPKHLKICGIK